MREYLNSLLLSNSKNVIIIYLNEEEWITLQGKPFHLD